MNYNAKLQSLCTSNNKKTKNKKITKRFMSRIFHSLTTIFIDEETIWFKNKTYIFVMIRAIFFGSNDLVSGSVVAVLEKKYTMS